MCVGGWGGAPAKQAQGHLLLSRGRHTQRCAAYPPLGTQHLLTELNIRLQVGLDVVLGVRGNKRQHGEHGTAQRVPVVGVKQPRLVITVDGITEERGGQRLRRMGCWVPKSMLQCSTPNAYRTVESICPLFWRIVIGVGLCNLCAFETDCPGTHTNTSTYKHIQTHSCYTQTCRCNFRNNFKSTQNCIPHSEKKSRFTTNTDSLAWPVQGAIHLHGIHDGKDTPECNKIL